MKQTLTLVLTFCLSFSICYSQTKVFKEVNNSISSQMKPIIQDGALIGYLVFTELEKASADSLNYRVTIMDENLNDIGVLNFRQEQLQLASVSFEQDVLCLAYVKSNFIGQEFKNNKEFKEARNNANLWIFTQFISLSGKIIKTNAVIADMKLSRSFTTANYYSNKAEGKATLKHPLRVHNLPGKGFACFYGDDSKNNILVYNTAGEQIWQKTIAEEAEVFNLFTSSNEVYLLLKQKNKFEEGGYALLGYNIDANKAYPVYPLQDKNGNALKVLAFDNDPITGKPYISGNIIDAKKGKQYSSFKHISKGTYCGVFTINLNGPEKKDRQELFSYWSDGSNESFSKKGRSVETRTYSLLDVAFKDYNGNTYFSGTSFTRKPRIGSIIGSVLTIPTVFVPFMILGANGTTKSAQMDAALLKQTANGQLSVDQSIPCTHSKTRPSAALFSQIPNDLRTFYTVSNSDTKSNYIIVRDTKNSVVYNVNTHKVNRTIPHKDGNIRTFLYPAKEGHVMVSEYNKKEKYTKFSIEAL